MTNTDDRQHRSILQRIAHRVMLEKGLVPDFPPPALAELDGIHGPATQVEGAARDLRNLLWCSIDNDDSRDLDQLTVAEAMPNGAAKVLVAIADVDAVVKKQSALDDHARQNTTSVYTVAEIFPMLPEKLSTDLTSLNLESDRLAIVIEMVLAGDGSLQSSDLYQATVRNRAKLAYNSVAAWLDGKGPMPPGIGTVSGLDENLRLQDRVAQKLKELRHLHGALDLETIEARPVFDGDELKDLEADNSNRAKDIIEDFMIAANGVTARYLASKQFPSLRRVVRIPKHWDRIVEPGRRAGFNVAQGTRRQGPGAVPGIGESRGSAPLSRSFSQRHQTPGRRRIRRRTSGRQRRRALRSGGQGLCSLHRPEPPIPRSDYPAVAESGDGGRCRCPTRTTNWQRSPTHCTEEEDAAKKVERQVTKSAAAILLESRIGEQFDAIVTGASDKGTWVRLTATAH